VDSTRSAGPRWTTCTTPPGPGPVAALPVHEAGRLRLGRHAHAHGHLVAEAHRRTRRRGRSSPTSTTWCRPSTRSSASGRRRWSTATSRTPSTASASPTPSTRPTLRSGRRPSTSTAWAAAASTTTAGWPAPSDRGSRGRRRCPNLASWDPMQDQWELFDTRSDYSLMNDLASEHPEKLEELKALFMRSRRGEQGPAHRGRPVHGGESPGDEAQHEHGVDVVRGHHADSREPGAQRAQRQPPRRDRGRGAGGCQRRDLRHGRVCRRREPLRP
jgi:hypothetical protein